MATRFEISKDNNRNEINYSKKRKPLMWHHGMIEEIRLLENVQNWNLGFEPNIFDKYINKYK